ncbi:MAG TPA: hypothetical protein VGF45_23815 [Polyangia bacterium]
MPLATHACARCKWQRYATRVLGLPMAVQRKARTRRHRSAAASDSAGTGTITAVVGTVSTGASDAVRVAENISSCMPKI